MEIFNTLESEVRSYSRQFPVVFERAVGSRLYDESGREHIDFFSGAGTVNYGHNNPVFKELLIDYLRRDGITHALDMATTAKRDFLTRFERVILAPRGLRYKVQFTGPTGTNAVEAALKLARKVTGRSNVLYFQNAYHGMTLGALAVTGNASKRRGAGVPLLHTLPVPFDGDLGERDTVEHLRGLLENPSSGVDRPAAVILETVQAEGGVRAAGTAWLQRLAELLREHGILLIADDIQVGCGRTGTFFSFEAAGIVPDIVCLSKSISGFGLPMALVLLRPELDVWSPGEHNGTFRGNNLAFITAAAALDYWQDDSFTREIARKAELVRGRLTEITARHPHLCGPLRGRGLIQGLHLRPEGLAEEVARAAFRRGLLIEAVGPKDEILKLLPPLVIEDAEIGKGIDILEETLEETVTGAKAQEAAAGAALR
ncbi:MAG TPA: diaminobutyrate--2-oxoglutarate transaminase [Thermoanaerobaculia bacterium]|jgi:diaminobutyrate-2-oxoglutarate transaminase|nr:diaminobutyrate--2-oxoglutarate transaminase [Thermoanaerobaculia bacterium]